MINKLFDCEKMKIIEIERERASALLKIPLLIFIDINL